MTNTQKSIVGGVAVLSIVGIICKLVGVFFRVPLVWLVGETGVGLYQLVYSTYNLLLTISSAGLPVAISRLVSASLTRNDPKRAKKIFKTALKLLAAIGFVMMIVMLAASGFLADKVVYRSDTRLGFMVIAPCVFLVCTLSAFRGFMQGQQNMVPTAISQLIEQVFKVAIALPLAYLGASKGIAYGAVGALLGTSIAEALALLYMVIIYYQKRSAFNNIPQLSQEPLPTTRYLAKQMLRIAIPITLGACIVPLSGAIDSAMMLRRLESAGILGEKATALYGCYTGAVINLINVPTALAAAISMSLVPAISAALTAHNKQGIKLQSKLGLRFAFLIGFPCSIGMSILAMPILHFFYGNTISADNLAITAELLSMSSLTILLFMVVQATSGILQGLKKQKIPMYTLMLGVACKIILNYVLIAIPRINIHGAPIASIVCYTVSLLPNLYYVLKHTELKFDWAGIVLKPALATAVMALVVWLLTKLLPFGRLSLLLEVGAGVLVYCASAYGLKSITKDDLKMARRKS